GFRARHAGMVLARSAVMSIAEGHLPPGPGPTSNKGDGTTASCRPSRRAPAPFARAHHAPRSPHRPGFTPSLPRVEIGREMVGLLPRLERFALRRAGNTTDAKDPLQEN